MENSVIPFFHLWLYFVYILLSNVEKAGSALGPDCGISESPDIMVS